DLPAAHAYAMKGNDIRPNSVGYVTLAQIRQREGADNVAIDSLCYKAYNLAINPGERIFVLQQIMRLYAKQERYEQAYHTSRAVIKARDIEARQREEHDVHNVQNTYVYKMKEQRSQRIICNTILIIVLLVLALALIILYFRYRESQNSKKMIQNKYLIKTYSQKIEEFKLSHQDVESTVKSLRKEITWLSERQIQIHIEGRKNYDHIMQGGTVSRWSKDDYIHFIEYYKLLDRTFVTHLENDYYQLSPRYQFFEILYHIGKSDQEVADIMGISNSTRRAIKTRVKGCVI
ncbi:MAG: hypothetical protein IJ920_02390, partial [Paludibacteraceae bacterium]|nr:hypothetical protein [Paludibacteraceae bacterium]